MSQTELEHLGDRIRRLRQERSLSQAELAGQDYSAAYISHLEKAKRRPSPQALEYIAGRLGVDVQHLATGRDPDMDLRLRVEVDRAIAQIHSGHADTARVELEALLERGGDLGLDEVCARAQEALALVAQRAGRLDEALERLSAAEECLGEVLPERMTPIVTARARCFFARGDSSGAIHVLERHLLDLTADGEGDPTALLQTYSALIGPYHEAGLKERAAQVAEAGFKLAALVEDPEHVACLHINRAQILLDKGHSSDAMHSLSQAEDLFTQIGWQDSAIKAAIASATAAVETGDLDRGERLIRRAVKRLDAESSVVDRVRSLNLLARIARLRGNPEEALTHLAEVELLDNVPRFEHAWSRREAGLSHRALNDLDRAKDAFMEALELYRAANAATAIATTAGLVGDVLVELDRTDEALTIYRTGLAAIEDLH